MSLRIAPIELRNGVWRVRWMPLIIWTLLFNAVVIGGVKLAIGPVKHPVEVAAQRVVIYSSPTDTAHVVGAVERGNQLDLHSWQANGWCEVSLTDAAPRIHGYVQAKDLSIPNSTREAAKQNRLQ